LIRFAAGSIVVSLFAMIGSALNPKSFAGLFAQRRVGNDRADRKKGMATVRIDLNA
jgi:hypothetical protein